MITTIQKPYLLFLGDVRGEPNAKTAFGLRDWCPNDCVGQWKLPGCDVHLGLASMEPRVAAAAGAKSMVLAVAPIGGAIPDLWIPSLVQALECGLDIVSGLHSRLSEIPQLRDTALRLGRALHDVRHPKNSFTVASGRKRTGKRLLTVGTDCAIGKKYTALALTSGLRSRGMDVDFRATGQTGILIGGSGTSIDAVVADFIAGAAESLSPDNHPDHWDIIEGQGSLFHPAYAGVTLGLIHGSQPDAVVLCHDLARRHINGYPAYPLPSLETAISRYLEAARLTNAHARLVAISLNTSRLTPQERKSLLTSTEHDYSVPCFDPMQKGSDEAIVRIKDWLQ